MPQDTTLADSLNPARIRILNWNIQKLSNQQWHHDFKLLNSELDLALFQEVHLTEPFLAGFDPHWCHSFAQGYTTRFRQTGVATLSTVQHITHQPFAICEPLLRTPKATNITTYRLENDKQELMVINLHAVNFSFGLGSYRQQLQQIEKILQAHPGPVIFAGDFNAWHAQRISLLKQLAEQLKLTEVHFEEDFRARFLGKHLDYVFIRGLEIEDAHTRNVISSDHNPMLATFSCR